MEILLSENDGFSFNFCASILGGGQRPNRGFSQQCSPVLPFLGFFRAISSEVPCVVTIEASAKCPEGLSLFVSKWLPLLVLILKGWLVYDLDFCLSHINVHSIWPFCLPEFGRHRLL